MLTEEEKRRYGIRMLQSRTRVLCKNGFLGVLLTHMRMVVDEHLPTAATDGTYIYFGKDFLENLNDRELDFVMMHEIMHVVLRHLERTGNRNHYLFNIASDIVINSTILESAGGDERAIHLGKYGTAMHLAPDGKEGAKYTAEEVYEQLKQELEKQEKKQGGQSGSGGQNSQDGSTEQDDCKSGEEDSGAEQSQDGVKNAEKVKPSRWHKGGCSDQSFDEHDRWKKGEPDPFEKDVWQKRIMDAAEAASRRGWGSLPAGVERSLDALKNPQTDWRTLLQAFIQEDITDYSFSPPDRRYDGGDFFMPDFNEKEETVRNILFMIDTSGSMSKAMLTAAYSEVKGAIDQFGGVLKGYLGFFDAAVADPKPFSDEEDFKVITPVGGGGTSFEIIFDYIEEKMSEELPACIIILTDGYAPFPEEERAQGIPVLWIINNEEVTPPWGTVARIK